MDQKFVVELHLEPDSELAVPDTVPFDVEEIRKCKIVTTVSRARYGKFRGSDACLLVIHINFLPFYNVRFKYAEVELRLVNAPAQPRGKQATIISYAPQSWQGLKGARNIQKGAHAGVNTGVATQPVTGVNAGVDAGVDRTVQYAELRQAWLISELAESVVSWRLCENDVTHEGIPRTLVGAIIVSAADNVAIRMKYEVKLSNSTNPLSWRAGHARMSKPLVLDRDFVGQGIGPEIAGIDRMEQEAFKLEDFVDTKWDL